MSGSTLEYRKSYYKKNREKFLEYSRQQYLREGNKRRAAAREKNPLNTLLVNVRCRAKRIGVEFNLTVDDLVIPAVCPVLNIPLRFNYRGGCPATNSPSVDRIDPTKGYTKDNVQIISYKANRMKNNATQEELKRFAEWVLRQ